MRVVATAGHVDHGKSTLIRLLTGMEPDRWSEEHRRGMTIDLGFAWTTLSDGETLAFVDVPGHERFVANMLAGIGPVPAVLFVVAADEGWMPQSDEHLEALHALGVRHGVLVITRSDLADPGEAARQARERLATTSLSGLPTVCVSGTTGEGAEELRRAIDDLVTELPRPVRDADPRLWVDRAFTIRGAGTVVTGTLPAGRLDVGRRMVLLPSDREVTVRGLQCLGTDMTHVDGLARVAVNLRGVDIDGVHRGDALVEPGRWLTTDVLDVRLRGDEARQLPRQLTLHVGSAAVPVRVRPLGDDTARLSSRDRLPLRVGDRALLRDPGGHRVPAGALVLDVRPPALTRRGAGRRRAAQLEEFVERPDGAAELHRRRLIRAEELRSMGAAPPADAPRAGPWLLDRSHRDVLASHLVELLTEYRSRHPLEGGLPTEAARRALDLPDAALLTTVLHAPAASAVSVRDGRLRLGSPELPEPVREAVRELRDRLASTPFRAPTSGELDELGLGSQQLAAATRAGELRKIDQGVFLLPDAPEQALRRLAELPCPFTLSQARQVLDTTRRVAVPLLELLARQRYTERLDDGTHRLR